MKKLSLSNTLWNLWCVTSVIGIWPRFIEPFLIQTSTYALPIQNLPSSLEGLKILQFSDLHLNTISDRFLDKIVRKIQKASPDLIVFTGDFLCYAQFDDKQKERLGRFLNQFSAPYGCYAVLGNHDYAEYVSINSKGDYDFLKNDVFESQIKKGFKRLFSNTVLSKKITPEALAIDLNSDLVDFLKTTPFTLLHNEHRLIPIKNSFLNLCGLGEYTLGKTDPKTFASYDSRYPGLVLLHNPDGIPFIEQGPGEAILCGHTHGGQVNLPWMWKKFTLLENLQFKRGLIHHQNKWVYVNRGIGSVFTFRWFAIPEILLLKLTLS